MKIGELAQRTNTPVETIRYYEREGLLAEPVRSEANYRVYEDAHAQRLSFIRHCRGLDMTLEEIRVLLRFKDARWKSSSRPCARPAWAHRTQGIAASSTSLPRLRETPSAQLDAKAMCTVRIAAMVSARACTSIRRLLQSKPTPAPQPPPPVSHPPPPT